MSQAAERISESQKPNWQRATTLNTLKQKRVKMVRIMGKQVALFQTSSGIRACDNKCPHEGYPLSEGDLSESCTLTCNWHNWKFNLETGENLYGGDSLRTYPVSVRGDEVWIDIQEPPLEQQLSQIQLSLRHAFDDERYDQIARECARLTLLNGDMLDAARWAIEWSWSRLEFGWTHAYAGMADWLALYQQYSGDSEVQLACVLEAVSHTAFDVLRQPEYPFTSGSLSWDESKFLQAIETENETEAIALAAGGLTAGMQYADFESALSAAALAHYNDFGHSLIYVTKLENLANILGDTVLRPLLFSLVRNLIFSTREDRIPEFRYYQSALDNWGNGDTDNVTASLWYRKSVKRALDATCAVSQLSPQRVYNELIVALATSMLGYDIDQQDKVRVPVSGNVGWLDFTHGLTFANAVRKQCVRYPELWPAGLLQMACFVGRNAAYTIEDDEMDRWHTDDVDKTTDEFLDKVLSHGQGEHIVSVHMLKTTLAVREEAEQLNSESAAILVAALNRFMHSPLSRQNPRRTAYQSLKFVGDPSATV